LNILDIGKKPQDIPAPVNVNAALALGVRLWRSN
jgi:hypothetical protein